MKNKLVVFDFDGTLTYKDSMLEFTKFYHNAWWYYKNMIYLSPLLIAYKVGLIPNWRAKEYFLMRFFKNEPITKFQNSCDRFALEKIPTLLNPAAQKELETYQKRNDYQVIIISSSAENWLQAWCQKMAIPLIATKLKTQQTWITGKLQGKNCYGKEKVNRLKAAFDLTQFEEIIVYGDSKGDYDLFKIATRHFYKPFRD